VTTGEENGEPVAVLFEGVANTDQVVGLTYGGRSSDGSFVGTSGVPVLVDSDRVLLRGAFASSFGCDDRDTIEVVIARPSP
jgi:hypothetical protein